MNGYITFLIACFFFITSNIYPQCCSVNPVAGATSIGILSKNTFRSISFYRHVYSDTYYEGSKASDFSLIKLADYDFIGSILSYGLSHKITLETELGYFIRKREIFRASDYTFTSRGLSSAVTSVKYNIYNKKQLEITSGIGLKFPFYRKFRENDGVQLPQSVQPSNLAMGGVFQLFISKNIPESKLRFFLINRLDVNATNQLGYNYGTALSSALFASKSFSSHFTGIFQIRNELRGYDYRNGNKIAASGGNILLISPQINYTLKGKWNFSVLTDLPVFRYNNGIQISNKYAYSISLVRDFDLSKN